VLPRKALTLGRTEHFATVVTYLQIPIQVCFSSTFPFVPFRLKVEVKLENQIRQCRGKADLNWKLETITTAPKWSVHLE